MKALIIAEDMLYLIESNGSVKSLEFGQNIDGLKFISFLKEVLKTKKLAVGVAGDSGYTIQEFEKLLDMAKVLGFNVELEMSTVFDVTPEIKPVYHTSQSIESVINYVKKAIKEWENLAPELKIKIKEDLTATEGEKKKTKKRMRIERL
jgi:uncharacterized NAD-dependent epimerase/dehydratase family protein